MKKRFLSIALILCMLLSIVPLTPVVANATENVAANDVTFTVLDGTPGKPGGTEDAKYAFDGSTDTKWCVQNAASKDTYVIVEASKLASLTSYTFTTGGDTASHSDRNPKSWMVYGSNDYYDETGYGTWEMIQQVTDGEMPTDDKAAKTFTVSDCGGFKYYKFLFTSLVGSSAMELFQLSEISLNCDGSDTVTPDFTGWTALTAENLKQHYDSSYDFAGNKYVVLPAGKYYLAEDIDLVGYRMTIVGSNKNDPTVIELNGHTLKNNEGQIDIGYEFDTKHIEGYLILQDVAQRERSYTYTEDKYGCRTYVDENTEGAKTTVLKGGYVFAEIEILSEYVNEERNRAPGTFVMRGGNVVKIENHATTYMSGGTVTGGFILSSNTPSYVAGGIYNVGTLIMSGDAKIQDCITVNTYQQSDPDGIGPCLYGGGVYNKTNAIFIMKDNSCIQNCHTKIIYAHKNSRNGGTGVYNNGTFQMLDNSLISGCTADKDNGGIGGAVYNVYSNNNSVFKADGGTIEGDVYNSNKYAESDDCIAILQNTTDDTATIIYGDVINDGKIEGGYLTTFMANGKPFAYEIRKSGQKAIQPKNPTLPYGTFKDWYKDEETTTKYDFTEETINEATTIYAGWNYTDYTVSFDTKGGSTTIDDKTVIWTDKVLNGETPVRAGYNFEGWSYKGKSVGVDTTYGSLAPVTELKITLTAEWTENSKYTITFNTAGETAVNTKTNVKWTDKVLDGVSDPTRDGYEFIGWKCEDVPVTTDTAYKELVVSDTVMSVTLTAQWEDVAAPTGEIKLGNNSWKTFLNNITFGLFFKDTQEITITAADNDGEDIKIEYLLSDKELTAEELATATFTAYSDKFTVEPNNEYVIYAKLSDETDNVAYINSNGIVLDNVAPIISGITNGETYCAAQTVTVSDKYEVTVTVNGTPVTLDANGQFTLSPASGTQTVVAKDRAGNVSAEMIVTVNDGHEGGTATCTKKAECKHCGLEYGDLDPANHEKESDEWTTKNETQHKKEWTCCHTVTVELENHEWNENGICTECGYGCIHSGGEATCKSKAKCEHCGNEYGEVNENNHTTLKHIEAKAATTEAEGNIKYWHCEDCDKYFSDKDGKNVIDLKDTVISKLPPEIIDGKGQSLTAGEKKELTFRSNAAFGDFIRVEVDGKTVDKKNYTVKEGSTIVTLNGDYVATLSAGEHTLGIVSESGTATTTFIVNAKVINDNTAPATGDNSHMVLWFALLFVSGGTLIGTAAFGKKKKYSVK